jgi:hypothetical protein
MRLSARLSRKRKGRRRYTRRPGVIQQQRVRNTSESIFRRQNTGRDVRWAVALRLSDQRSR